MVMRVPKNPINYNFPYKEGISFHVHTNRRKNEYEVFEGNNVSAVISNYCLQVYKDGKIHDYDDLTKPWE